MKDIEWRDVLGYEGRYLVSNYGDIISLHGRDGKIIRKMVPIPNNKGYLTIKLSTKGTCKTFKIHRLVAIAFIPNTDNKSQVNHIDEDKTNNCVSNLNWVTAKENTNHGTCQARRGATISKGVLQFDLNGNIVKEWKSKAEARRIGGYSSTSISSVCSGTTGSHAGYFWGHVSQDIIALKEKASNTKDGVKRKVIQYTLNMEELNKWDSASEASRRVPGSCSSHIAGCCKGRLKKHNGFIWRYL